MSFLPPRRLNRHEELTVAFVDDPVPRLLFVVVGMTIVNVALPSIQRDMGFSQSGLAWVINAYLIAFGGFLLLAGRLGDLLGRKRIFLVGLGMFTAASLLCGLSISQ